MGMKKYAGRLRDFPGRPAGLFTAHFARHMVALDVFSGKQRTTRQAGCEIKAVTMVQGGLNMKWVAAGVLLVAAALCLTLPDQLVTRAYLLSETPEANIWLIYALGAALAVAGVALLLEPRAVGTRGPLWACLLVAAVALFYFLTLTRHLQGWWIDDAGITFAYSRSLAEGLGLVAQPWLPPEEGYSSSIWMVLLSLMGRLGFDIPLAAKTLGLGFSAACMIVCAVILTRETRSPLTLAVFGVAMACGPTVVWAVSGQEHALQSLLLLLVVLCVYCFEAWRWPVALILAVLVLTRPETPIIVIAVFCTAVFLTRHAGGPLFNVPDLAVALVPFAAFCALMGFRLLYFGDLFPNPYYAKSSGTGLTGILNPLGGGWAYILSGLRDRI